MAKASFVAAAQGPAGESLWGEFANTPAGFGQWQGRVTAAAAEHNAHAVVVVLEPSGGYEQALAGFAAAQGWQVGRPNALRVHDLPNSQGRRAKTDRQDARFLTLYGAAQLLAAWKPLPRAYSELESLLQRQDDLDSMLQQERKRETALALQAGAALVVAVSLAAVLLSLETAVLATPLIRPFFGQGWPTRQPNGNRGAARSTRGRRLPCLSSASQVAAPLAPGCVARSPGAAAPD